MKKETNIYGLVDPRSGKIRYVGKANNPEARYRRHIKDSTIKSTHKECWLFGLIRDGFMPELVILEVCDYSLWKEREIYHISRYDNLTNLTIGGEGISGYKASEEAKRLRSENSRGEDNPFYGKKHTADTIKLLSEINKSRDTNGENNSFYGKTHTPESRKVISDSGKKRWERGELHLPPVMCGKDNPASKERIFISPSGKKYVTYSLKKFCQEYDLSYHIVMKNINKGKILKPIDKATLDRQRYKSKNSIGWEIIE